jgi:hypothetical protein
MEHRLRNVETLSRTEVSALLLYACHDCRLGEHQTNDSVKANRHWLITLHEYTDSSRTIVPRDSDRWMPHAYPAAGHNPPAAMAHHRCQTGRSLSSRNSVQTVMAA